MDVKKLVEEQLSFIEFISLPGDTMVRLETDKGIAVLMPGDTSWLISELSKARNDLERIKPGLKRESLESMLERLALPSLTSEVVRGAREWICYTGKPTNRTIYQGPTPRAAVEAALKAQEGE